MASAAKNKSKSINRRKAMAKVMKKAVDHIVSSEVKPMTLSVVIPALNEEDGIAGIVERVLATEESLKTVGVTELEVIVVDDGSVDGTARIVQQMEKVKLVRHSVNHGYGAAIKTGFGRAKGDLLAFLDADSTYPPEYFAKLCDVAIRESADVIFTGMPRALESVDGNRVGAHALG